MHAVRSNVDLDSVCGLDKAWVARNQTEHERRQCVQDKRAHNEPKPRAIQRIRMRITTPVALRTATLRRAATRGRRPMFRAAGHPHHGAQRVRW